MIVRFVFVLLAAALAPAALLSVLGGGDLDLPGGIRVSWFEPGPFGLGLTAALVAATLGDRDRWVPRLLLVAAAVVLVLLGYVAWAGPIRLPWLRVTNPWPPAAESAGLVALAVLAGARPIAPFFRTVLAPSGALLAGGLTLLAFVAADRADLERRVAEPRTAHAGPDVIFVLVDTLRADALGAYGAMPSPSPWIDAQAARALFFESAFAQAPWTYASVSSFMTSRHPSDLNLQTTPRDGTYPLYSLEAAVPRLAETLRASGWHTAGFYTNPFLGPGSGIEVGFDVFEFVGGPGRDVPTAGWVVDAALGWGQVIAEARAAGDRAPTFLYLHFMEPHLDYQPPKAFWSPEALAYRGSLDGSSRRLQKMIRSKAPFSEADLAFLRSLYRGEVAFLDGELARLASGLETLGLWNENVVFVLTADHGEQIGEHGEFEHGDVHAENLHVPFFLSAPGVAPRRVPQIVRLLDLAPTLLDVLGLPTLPGAEGRSLLPLARGQALPPLPAITEHPERFRVTTEAGSLLFDHGTYGLYDWVNDRAEERDLAAARPEQRKALQAMLDAHRARAALVDPAARGPVRSLDPDTRDALKALGYL